MKSGDLVELCIGDEGRTTGAGWVCVANEMDKESDNQYISTGTLAVYVKKKKGAPDPAVVILIDGQLCWVWQDEIRPVTHNGGDYETR